MATTSINGDFPTNSQRNSQMGSITTLENLTLPEIGITVMSPFQERTVNINPFHGIFISIWKRSPPVHPFYVFLLPRIPPRHFPSLSMEEEILRRWQTLRMMPVFVVMEFEDSTVNWSSNLDQMISRLVKIRLLYMPERQEDILIIINLMVLCITFVLKLPDSKLF